MFVEAYSSRTAQALITLLDGSGNEIGVHALNRLRLKIGREGETPILDLVDGVGTPNGSYITLANPLKLFLHQDDLTFAAGIYDMQIALLDRADAQKISLIAKGYFVLHGTIGAGDITVD